MCRSRRDVVPVPSTSSSSRSRLRPDHVGTSSRFHRPRVRAGRDFVPVRSRCCLVRPAPSWLIPGQCPEHVRTPSRLHHDEGRRRPTASQLPFAEVVERVAASRRPPAAGRRTRPIAASIGLGGPLDGPAAAARDLVAREPGSGPETTKEDLDRSGTLSRFRSPRPVQMSAVMQGVAIDQPNDEEALVRTMAEAVVQTSSQRSPTSQNHDKRKQSHSCYGFFE